MVFIDIEGDCNQSGTQQEFAQPMRCVPGSPIACDYLQTGECATDTVVEIDRAIGRDPSEFEQHIDQNGWCARRLVQPTQG